jgi:hypothetical protein
VSPLAIACFKLLAIRAPTKKVEEKLNSQAPGKYPFPLLVKWNGKNTQTAQNPYFCQH